MLYLSFSVASATRRKDHTKVSKSLAASCRLPCHVAAAAPKLLLVSSYTCIVGWLLGVGLDRADLGIERCLVRMWGCAQFYLVKKRQAMSLKEKFHIYLGKNVILSMECDDQPVDEVGWSREDPYLDT